MLRKTLIPQIIELERQTKDDAWLLYTQSARRVYASLLRCFEFTIYLFIYWYLQFSSLNLHICFFACYFYRVLTLVQRYKITLGCQKLKTTTGYHLNKWDQIKKSYTTVSISPDIFSLCCLILEQWVVHPAARESGDEKEPLSWGSQIRRSRTFVCVSHFEAESFKPRRHE